MVKEAAKLPDVPDKRQVLIELSCASQECNPCTYPNCQRYVRETTRKKKPLVTNVTEISTEEFRRLARMPRTKE
jgi:hypothetical protein